MITSQTTHVYTAVFSFRIKHRLGMVQRLSVLVSHIARQAGAQSGYDFIDNDTKVAVTIFSPNLAAVEAARDNFLVEFNKSVGLTEQFNLEM